MKIIQKSLILSIIITSVTLSGCSLGINNTPVSRSGLYFDTIVSVTLYGAGSDADAILDECMAMCSRYEDLFDPNIITSDIAKINSSAGEKVYVDHDTAQCLIQTLAYSDISGGRFDITIKPVYDLWDWHANDPAVPPQERINAALPFVGYDKITVDPTDDTVTSSAGTSVELGASAKGYIADKIGEYLKSQSITGAIINMGGDMSLIGSKPGGDAFTIGINDPLRSGSTALTLYLTDTAVATSGTYERCFTYDGRKYHHILDTSTGYPVQTDIISATVICANALDSDCLCTLSVIEGSEEAMKLIEQTPGTEAVFILNDGRQLRSSGAGTYIRQ